MRAILFPEIGKDKAWLELSNSHISAQRVAEHGMHYFKGRPTAIEGNMFKSEWFRYYSELPEQMDEYRSWDTHLKTYKASDYVVGQIWGVEYK